MTLHPDKRILFNEDIIEPADGDHPEFILAEKNAAGTIIKKSDFFYSSWLVKPDKGNSFYVNETEIREL